MDLIIITGMSGAGKSTAMMALEDIGYFCVDNVPPQMIGKFIELHKSTQGYAEKMALAVDSRSFKDLEEFSSSIDEVEKDHTTYKLIFLDADDTVLLNRYKENRRTHPLFKGEIKTIEQAIAKERELLNPIKNSTEYLVDTTHSNMRDLKKYISEIASQQSSDEILVQCMSFGFKYGMPMEPDLVFDVRCLPNPFYMPELKNKTGMDQEVKDYVMKSDESKELLAKINDMLDFLIPLYKTEGKKRLVVAIGCTGGKHRSVTFAEEISKHLKMNNIDSIAFHRDFERVKH